MREIGKLRRSLAALLAACMLLPLLPVSPLAEEDGETITVAAFEALDDDVAKQTVPAETARENLNLPHTLRADVYTTAPDTESVVIEGVTWEPDVLYEGSAGSYTFTASAAEYIPAQGVDWPVIAVTVEEGALEQITGGQPEKLAEMMPLSDTVAAYIGVQSYSTLAEAFAAATSTDSDHPTVIELATDLTFGADGDITAGIAVPAGKAVKLTSRGNTAYTISRNAANDSIKDYYFKVYDGCTLILENVILDGKNLATNGSQYFAAVAGADLVLEDGAVLKNNTSSVIRAGTGDYTNTVSAITMNGGEISGNSARSVCLQPNFVSATGKTLRFTMNGGVIKNNTAEDSGAGIYATNSSLSCTAELIIHNGEITGNHSTCTGNTVKGGGGVYCDSVFQMDGGTVSDNSAALVGGGVYFSSGVTEASITGGTIENNTAGGMSDTDKGKGENIYVNQTQNLVLSPSADLDGIFLYLGASLLISSALQHRIIIEGAYNRNTDMLGLPVAAGSGYTLTEGDLAKFSYKDNTYGFSLGSNQIKLAEKPWTVQYALANMTAEDQPCTVAKNGTLNAKISAADGYKLPKEETVTVTMGGATLTQGREYVLMSVNSHSYAIGIFNVTGDVVITAAGIQKSSDATLSALTYYYARVPGDVAVPGFAADAKNPTYEVTLPASVAKNATIYVDKTKSDKNATSSGDDGYIELSEGRGTWTVTITAEDGVTTNTYTVNFALPHTHCVCGGGVTTGGHTHSDADWSAWSSADSLPYAAGSYYLTQDVAGVLYVPSNATISLCLNGHKITASGSGSAVTLEHGATLNICDCNGSSGSHSITDPVTNKEITITGGLITGGTTNNGLAGGGVDCKGELNLYGGSIAGNTCTAVSGGGGGVYVYAGGVFHMYGGTVQANKAAYWGGGVGVYPADFYQSLEMGQFYLHGGLISGNNAPRGGGVINEGAFHMDGGKISGNTAASDGSGLWAARFDLSGGEISGNHTESADGCGVCIYGYDDFILKDSPVITGNTAGDQNTVRNLYFQNGQTVTVGGEGLTDGASIGVSTAVTIPQLFPVNVTTANSEDYSHYFTSDNAAYAIMNGNSNMVQLRIKSSDANLYNLFYKVQGGAETAVPGFNKDTTNYTVALPAGIAQNALITLSGLTQLDAAITANEGVTLENGSGTATITVTAENGAKKTYTVKFGIQPAAPAVTAAIIDYRAETVSFDASLEMNTEEDFSGASVAAGTISNLIPAHGKAARPLYIRVKAAGDVPASTATAISIPARPQTPEDPAVTTDANALTATVVSGVEYTVNNWTTSNTTGVFDGLNPGTAYTVKARVAATENSFKSEESSKNVRTLTVITAPTGANEAKGGIAADKAKAEVGDIVTYTVTYTDDYTPTLILSGNSNTLSTPEKVGNNLWTYTYTIHANDTTVGADVTFAPRQIESVSYIGGTITLFADDVNNASEDALKAYLEGNAKVVPIYDNGTTGAEITASYELTTGTWVGKGGSYTYTATANGKTCEVRVTVKQVKAAVGAVKRITKAKTDTGYTTHAALDLPASAVVTYTGDGYTTKTVTLAFSWSKIPADFGKTLGSHDFTGAVTLPAWASYTSNTTTATVTISDKTPLTEEQMTLFVDGWIYGDTAKTPNGSVTVTGDNGSITYQYSADNGSSWMDSLPTSAAGAPKTGDYLVRMNYEGDAYIGSKTAEFTVAQKAVIPGVGTLTANKTYDGNTTATLTGTPALSGVLDGDTVTAEGVRGTYASADAGTGIAVTVAGFTLTGTDAGNYTTNGTVSGLTGTIIPADGKTYSGYTDAQEALRTVHIVTNVTPTLGDVTLPTGWSFTGDKTVRITASNVNSGKQPFPVRYTPENANYAPVDLTGDMALFPVSAVTLEVNGGLDMRTIDRIGDTLTLSSAALKVTGAALPDTGPYAIANMEWSSSVPSIATVTGAVTASGMSAAVTAVNKGVSMVGVAYKNSGDMLGYVLVQIVGDRTDSANTVEDIISITETMNKLIDPARPSDTDKMAVDAVAKEVTKLPESAKADLTIDDVKTLDELKKAVGESIPDGDKKLTITIEDDAGEQIPAPENVKVVGAAIACGVDSGNVVITVKPMQPSGSGTKLELQMKMTVDKGSGAIETQLQAPLFFQLDVPEDIALNKLTLYHVKDDGTKTVLPFERMPDSRTISFKMLSFSSVQFVVSTGGSGGGSATYTLTATAGDGGKISPSGKVRVSRNSSKTFTITPADGYEIAEVLVDGKSVGAVSSYTFEKVRSNYTIAASFRTEGQQPDWNPFTDVKEGTWYYDSVKYVYEHGLMNGTDKTMFSPDLSTTRGMIVTILWRLENEPESGAGVAFTDVESGSYCYEAIRWAAEHKIVKGYTATTFGPDSTITRQELAAILYRYAQYKGRDVSAADDLAAFTDRPDPWAGDAMKWAVGVGIIFGEDGVVLDCNGQATRAQVAAMLTRFLQIN